MRSFIICLTVCFLILSEDFLFAEEYLIVVSYEELKLVLLKDGSEILVFPVAVPRRTPKNLPIKGVVKEIIKNPVWAPTAGTRKYYLEKKKMELPAIVEPSSPLNAMGKAKMMIDFKTAGVNKVIRVHGTNDESSIGKRITRGCIRLYNKDILELANRLEGSEARIEFREKF